ncbi:MAG: hypothetical protein GC192_20720 [Bacteroidetes bacterium]|nr:hypothetical protein [Bacteroidota bacterium]
MKITMEEAAEQAVKELVNRIKSLKDNMPLITKAEVYPWGWLFFYNSKLYIENGDPAASYIGGRPIFFDKNDLSMSFIGLAAWTIEEGIEEYRLMKGYPPLEENFEPESIKLLR